MTSEELSAIRSKLGLTQLQFGEIFGYSWTSVSRMEGKKAEIPNKLASQLYPLFILPKESFSGLLEALIYGGNNKALYFLLNLIYGENKPKGATSSSAEMAPVAISQIVPEKIKEIVIEKEEEKPINLPEPISKKEEKEEKEKKPKKVLMIKMKPLKKKGKK